MDTNTGTFNLGGQENSYGNVMPDVTLPWAFATWAPSNDITSGGGWWFDSHATHLAGIRYTKQPSPWIGDYGYFNIASHVVNPQHDGKTGQVANFAPLKSQFSPYLFNATLTNYGTASGAATVAVTPTSHGAIMRFTYPPPDADAALTGSYNATRRVFFSLPASAGNAVAINGTGSAASPLSFAGAATDNLPQHGALHFVATLVAESGAALAPLSTGSGQDGGQLWAWADFDAAAAASDVLIVRVATSLISPAQAQAAFNAQVAGVDFDGALAIAKAAWHDIAMRVTIDDIGAGRTDAEAADFCAIFYSSLYRAAKFPRSLWEVDYANGNAPIHWSPYKGGVFPGPLSSDVGFWDAFRTTFSLLSLIRPDHLADELEGFLNTYRENGCVFFFFIASPFFFPRRLLPSIIPQPSRLAAQFCAPVAASGGRRVSLARCQRSCQVGGGSSGGGAHPPTPRSLRYATPSPPRQHGGHHERRDVFRGHCEAASLRLRARRRRRLLRERIRALRGGARKRLFSARGLHHLRLHARRGRRHHGLRHAAQLAC